MDMNAMRGRIVQGCRAERSAVVMMFVGLMAMTGVAQPWAIGARGHFGFLWPHRPSSWILVEGHSSAAELFMERRFSGNKAWHRDYPGASYGFGAWYTRLSDTERTGRVVRVMPFLHIPFVHREHQDLGVRLGWGVGHVERPYHRQRNTKQIAIGSHLNTAIQMMVAYRRRFGSVECSGGVGVDHLSNGSFALPNLGLNLLSANMSLAYVLAAPKPLPALPDTVVPVRPRREQSLVAAGFWSETGRPESGRHSVFTAIGQVQWRTSRTGALSAGVDLFNKGALRTDHPSLVARSRSALTQVGAHGGYALLFGPSEVFIQMGAYVHTPVRDHAAVFHRLGCRHRIGRHWMAHLALKSHFAVADHWEFGLGYRWS